MSRVRGHQGRESGPGFEYALLDVVGAFVAACFTLLLIWFATVPGAWVAFCNSTDSTDKPVAEPVPVRELGAIACFTGIGPLYLFMLILGFAEAKKLQERREAPSYIT